MSNYDLKNMRVGDQIHEIFALTEKRDAKTGGGQPFQRVTLQNRSGRAEVMVWANIMHLFEGIDPLRAVLVCANVTEYKGRPQLSLITVEDRGDSHPLLGEINPVCPESRESLVARFTALTGSVGHEGYALFLKSVFTTDGLWGDYTTAPAASRNHHAYIGGLLQHSVEVTEDAVALAASHRYAGRVNHDLLIAGALLHDIGKIVEYEWKQCPIRVSEAGYLSNHMAFGPQIAHRVFHQNREALEAAGFQERDLRLIEHIQVSHHGQIEWGALVPPRCLEALIVHQADLSSAHGTKMLNALDDGNPTGLRNIISVDHPARNLVRTLPPEPPHSEVQASAEPDLLETLFHSVA